MIANLIWDFELPRQVCDAVSNLSRNAHGIVTLPEFVLLCRHYPLLLRPLLDLRDLLSRKLLFRRFWRQITVRRIYYHGSKSAFDILGTLSVKQQQTALERLLVDNHFVPHDFARKWLNIVATKPGDEVEKLPFEIDPAYVPPDLPIPQQKLHKVTLDSTSMYKEKLEAQESSRNLLKPNSKSSVKSNVSAAKSSKSGTPYVARKPLVEDDGDIKKLLKKINKEVKRQVAMSKIDSRSVRQSKIAPFIPSSAPHYDPLSPNFTDNSRRLSFVGMITAPVDDDDINDPDDTVMNENDEDSHSRSRRSRRWSRSSNGNVKRAVY
jgi:hypothetical protein